MARLASNVKPSRYNVPNLERGLKILEHLLDHPEGLQQSELAATLGYSKSSVFRVTMTLMEFGYLARDEKTKSLVLTRKLLAMGNRALVEKDLMATSIDVMNKLRDVVRETVLLGTLVEDEFIVLGQVLGSHPFKFSIDIGSRVPLHTSAPAKAILALMPPEEARQIVEKIEFVRHTATTITSAGNFMKELETIRAEGYALDRGEQLTGILCVAAAIQNRHGYPIAAIWTTGPTDRIGERDIPEIGAAMIKHARMISTRLGFGLLEK